MESIGPNVDQEPADELGCGQAHDLLTVTVFDTVVLPAEGHGIGIRTDQPMVRDRNPKCVSAQVCQHLLRSAEGWLGIHHPFRFALWGEPLRDDIRLHQAIDITKEGELALLMQIHEAFEE